MIRNRIIYILALLASFIFIYFYGGAVPYALFYTIILLPIVSLALFIISYKYTKLSFDIKALRIIQNEAFSLEINLNNRSLVILPFIKLDLYNDKKVFNKKHSRVTLTAYPKQSQDISIDIFCKYRGRYNVSVKKVVYYDFLCLFNITKRFDEREIKVLPKITPITELIMIDGRNFGLVISKRFKPDDVTEVLDIKEYITGESIRYMHWKLSSKKDKLLMKSFAKEQNCCIAIIIDISDKVTDIDMQDMLIEKASSLLYYCYENEIRCSIYYYDNGIVHLDMESLSDYYSLYEALAEIKFCPCPSLKIFTNEIIYAKNNFENLSIISLDEELSAIQNISDDIGYNVISMMGANKQL